MLKRWRAKVKLFPDKETYLTTLSTDLKGAIERMEQHSLFISFITQPKVIQP